MKLSVIIPCYNSARTLQKAIDSCYTQELPLDQFEVILVDDGSTDGTRSVMETAAAEHSNLRLIFHEHNRGGGAARNTGIAAATGVVIFCLDSDNLFAPKTVAPVLAKLESEGLDGLAFYNRRFFFGHDIRLYTSHLNTVLDRDITLFDLFSPAAILLDNFFFTKASYQKTDGYPEHHGFDTQCFEMRYLAAGNRVRVAADSYCYHRQAAEELSYFERVHASGLFSVNFMLIFEDIFHLFTPAIQTDLVTFPLFANNKSYKENALAIVKNAHQSGQSIFIDDYLTYLTPHGRTDWLTHYSGKSAAHALVTCFVALNRGDGTEASAALNRFLSERASPPSPYLLFLALRVSQVSAGVPVVLSVKSTLSSILTLTPTPLASSGSRAMLWLRRHPWLHGLVQRILRRVR